MAASAPSRWLALALLCAVQFAVLSTIATSTGRDAVDTGTPPPFALTDGFRAAVWTGARIGLIGLLVSILLVRARDLRRPGEIVGNPALDRGGT
jgi:hypothetical protein